MKAAYVEIATGRIMGVMSGYSADLGAPPMQGCRIMEVSDSTAMPAYHDGTDVVRVPDSPGEWYEWNWVTKVWEDTRTLEDIKSAAHKEIVRRRDAVEYSQFTYSGMVFDGDSNAQRRLAGYVSAAKSAIAAGHTFTKDFTLADNSVVQLTAEDFIGIEMAKLWQVDVAFQEYLEKKARIDSATNLEELESICAV